MHKSPPDRTAQAPSGRAYPPVASLPSPRRFASACRGLRPLKNAWPTASDVYQGRGKPRRWPLHCLRTHRAPRQLDSPEKAGLAGKAVCRGRAQPQPPARAGRPQVERQEKGPAARGCRAGQHRHIQRWRPASVDLASSFPARQAQAYHGQARPGASRRLETGEARG